MAFSSCVTLRIICVLRLLFVHVEQTFKSTYHQVLDNGWQKEPHIHFGFPLLLM